MVLLELHAWNGLSSPTIQKIAEGALKDGNTHGDIRFLAGLGNHGKNPGHCRGQLYRRLKKPRLDAAIGTLQLPFKLGFNRPSIYKEVPPVCFV